MDYSLFLISQISCHCIPQDRKSHIPYHPTQNSLSHGNPVILPIIRDVHSHGFFVFPMKFSNNTITEKSGIPISRNGTDQIYILI